MPIQVRQAIVILVQVGSGDFGILREQPDEILSWRVPFVLTLLAYQALAQHPSVFMAYLVNARTCFRVQGNVLPSGNCTNRLQKGWSESPLVISISV